VRILFFCQYFTPEMGAPAARTHEHARRWVARGHDVTVLCGLPNHPDGIVPEAYRGRWLYRENIDGINVLRCWFFVAPNRGVFKRCVSFLSFMVSAVFFGVTATGKCDVVIGTTPQMLCALGGYIVSCFKRRPFILEVRDLWPKHIIDLGTITNPLIIRGLKGLEMFLYRRSRAVIAVAEASRRHIEDLGVPASKLHTITNGIDEEFFVPKPKNGLRAEHGWSEKFVVLYIGTHGLSQGLDTILDTAALLSREPRYQFVFVGSGAERDNLRDGAYARELTNVVFLPSQQKALMPEYYAAADACLVPLKKRDVFRYNIPSKMFEIMASARPMILGATGQAQQLLEEAGAGIAVEPENPEAYRDAIVRLAEDSALAESYGRSGREHVVANYTRNSKADAFLECLEGTLGVAAGDTEFKSSQSESDVG
jgi:colanic acid biosynthesis glycosyl transferase WcaI